MNSDTKLILASGSPRRKELLEQAGFSFDVVVSDVEEITESNASPAHIAQQNARIKAMAVAKTLPSDFTIIGADTIVVLNNHIFGKPVDVQEASAMLHELSGKTHQVITGVCIIHNDDVLTFAESTDVTFKQLSGDEISNYVATGEPLDKAGAYGIQGIGKVLVDHIDGDYNNVVGLPVARLQRALDLER